MKTHSIDDLRTIIADKTKFSNVYIQPPTRLMYPCILITPTSKTVIHADNRKYALFNKFELKIISDNPNDSTVDDILELPYTSYDRTYIADGLHHDVINIVF